MEEEGEDVSNIPIIREAPGKILQEDRKTLQKTLLLQKVENDQATAELIQKKQEFKEQMEDLASRTGAFIQKELDSRARALNFGIYINDCEKKRRRAIKKYQTERELTQRKRQQIQKLKEELGPLKVRLEKLQKKVTKYKLYEDFLQKLAEVVPSNDLDGVHSVINPLLKRHQTLLTANQTLMGNLSSLQQNLEDKQHEFGMLQEEHNTAKIVMLPSMYFDEV